MTGRLILWEGGPRCERYNGTGDHAHTTSTWCNTHGREPHATSTTKRANHAAPNASQLCDAAKCQNTKLQLLALRKVRVRHFDSIIKVKQMEETVSSTWGIVLAPQTAIWTDRRRCQGTHTHRHTDKSHPRRSAASTPNYRMRFQNDGHRRIKGRQKAQLILDT